MRKITDSKVLFSFPLSLKVLCLLLYVMQMLAFPEEEFHRILRGGGSGGGGSSGGSASTNKNKSHKCPEKSVTFTNPDGSIGWKIKQQCSSDYGSIIGGIVGGIFGFALFLLIIRYYAENLKLNRKQKVEKCVREAIDCGKYTG